MTDDLLTGDQFALLARLLRSHGKSREGCRLVLVEGMRQCDAARQLNVDPVLIAMSLRLYRRAHADIVLLLGAASEADRAIMRARYMEKEFND